LPMRTYSPVVLALLPVVGALRLPVEPSTGSSRRGVLLQAASAAATLAVAAQPACAAVSEIGAKYGTGAISKEELYAAAAARKEADRVAQLPINKFKAQRAKLDGAKALIESRDWNSLRDLIVETTGPTFSQNKKDCGLLTPEARDFSITLRKNIVAIDTVAYSQQSILPAALTGFCADGVVPREEGGCKVKPTVDTAPLLSELKEAIAAFDGLIALY